MDQSEQPNFWTSRKINKKILLFGAIAILATAIAGGVYVWQTWEILKSANNQILVNVQKPNNETADWQTYRNVEYGFEFKYPKDWGTPRSVSIDENQKTKRILEFEKYGPNQSPGVGAVEDGVSLVIRFSENSSSSLDQMKAEIFNTNTKVFSLPNGIYGKETLDEQFYNEGIYQGKTAKQYDAVAYYKKANGFLEITFISVEPPVSEKDSQNYEKIFQSILSTFKFIEPIDTSSWQTYRNEEYGFEVKYPADWELSENSGSNFDLSVISIISPETQKLAQDKQVSYLEDISVYYYPSVSEESENVANKLGATTLEELIKKNPAITKIGTIEISGVQATDVIWGGQGAYYVILATKNSHLYKIWFSNIGSKDKLTSVEKIILSTFKFIK
jgi:hypothetical protein